MVDAAGTDGNCTGMALDSPLAPEDCPDEEDLNILTNSLSFMQLLRSMQRAREALCSGETRRGDSEAPLWTPPGGARRGSTPPSWDERNHGRPSIGAGPRLRAPPPTLQRGLRETSLCHSTDTQHDSYWCMWSSCARGGNAPHASSRFVHVEESRSMTRWLQPPQSVIRHAL